MNTVLGDAWLLCGALKDWFPGFFSVSNQCGSVIGNCGFWDGLEWIWNFHWWRKLFQWKLDLLSQLHEALRPVRLVNNRDDRIAWKYNSQGIFSTNSFVQVLQEEMLPEDVTSYSFIKSVWKGLVPPSVELFTCINQEATADNNASVNNNMPVDTLISNDAANPNSRSANDIQSQSSSNLREKTDLAWKYIALQMENGKPQYQCLFCLQVFKGGGIHMIKKHLEKITGDVKKCPKVSYDVEKHMEKGGDEVEDAIDKAIAQEELEQQRTSSKQGVGGEPKKKAKVIPPMFAPRTTPRAQPSIKSVQQNKEAIHEVDKRFARWLLDCKIPFNAMMSPYFQDMLDGVAGIGPGYKGPSYDKLRVHLLADLKREIQMLVDSYKSAWKETRCTLIADGWTDQRQRTLINFLVYCSKGLCFVKSVDASSMVKNASHLCNLFSKVIEWIDPNDIVHVVTDNAANYVAAGRLINRKYDNIYWSPCAAHCLNLILKDISSMAHISNLATRASKITVFVYNHTVFLSWLRQKPHWREIVRPGATCFATVFITLKSIFDHKMELQALVVDSIFTDHKLGRSVTGRAVSAIILDCKFWDDCFTVCKLVGPLIYLLRVVDADDKPSLGYVYEGMLRAEDAIKEMFKQSKTAYQPYTDIINSRWDKHLKKDLHAAAYFLNPKFFFNENYKEAPDVMRGLLDLFTLYCKCNNLDSVQTMKEIHLYKDRKESFDRQEAIRAASELKPGEIDADLYQNSGSSNGLYAASLDSFAQQGGNEGEDHPTETDLQQVLVDFNDL
ncbi:uncharacterized protein [Arachis hypogaea]|uniref:uncharacterized protein n=1 Tax=Arachis hypogaea TaxID=3818 RepID=UPI003B20D248